MTHAMRYAIKDRTAYCGRLVGNLNKIARSNATATCPKCQAVMVREAVESLIATTVES